MTRTRRNVALAGLASLIVIGSGLVVAFDNDSVTGDFVDYGEEGVIETIEQTARPTAIGDALLFGIATPAAETDEVTISQVSIVGLSENAEFVGAWAVTVGPSVDAIITVDAYPPRYSLRDFEDMPSFGRDVEPVYYIAVAVRRTGTGVIESEGIEVHYRVKGREENQVFPSRLRMTGPVVGAVTSTSAEDAVSADS